jgi:excisionase family DNA binding protein
MVTVNEYAKARRVHPSTVRRWVKSGSLTAERHGRTIRISTTEGRTS